MQTSPQYDRPLYQAIRSTARRAIRHNREQRADAMLAEHYHDGLVHMQALDVPAVPGFESRDEAHALRFRRAAELRIARGIFVERLRALHEAEALPEPTSAPSLLDCLTGRAKHVRLHSARALLSEAKTRLRRALAAQGMAVRS